MATKRPNGKWRAQVYIGTDENGKRIYKSFEADTADEADYLALTYKLGKGKRTREKITLRAAMEAYINSKEGILSPATIEGYRVILRNFGDFLDSNIEQINALSLQYAIKEYAMRPKKKKHDGDGAISSKTVRNAYGLISATLRQHGIKFEGISLPKAQAVKYNTPFDDTLKQIFAITKGTSIEIPVLLIAWCSLRTSEICGLKYSDVDFDNGLLYVRRARIYINGVPHEKATKTETSVRTVFLPAYIANLIKEKQERDGGEWIITIKGETIGREFAKRLKRAGLPHCRFYDLRHSFVSVLTKHGVDKKYIQEMGGWSSDLVMNKVYKQTDMDLKRTIAGAVDNVFNNLLS